MKRLFNVFVIMLVGILFSCNNNGGKREQTNATDPGFSTYISGYSTGMISSQASLRIRLAKPVSGVEPNMEVMEDVLHITPSVKGKLSWVDNRTLEFVPEKALKNGGHYQMDLYLDKILDTEKKYETFSWAVDVIEQAMALENPQIVTKNSDIGKMASTLVSISTADFVEAELFEDCFTAKYNGDKVSVQWHHSENGKQHDLMVNDLLRSKEDSYLLMEWNMNSIGIKEKNEKKIVIPGTNTFKILSVRAFPEPDKYIRIELSEALDPKQDANGMIYLASGKELSLSIDNNVILAYPTEITLDEEELIIDKNLRNESGITLNTDFSLIVHFQSIKPEVRWVGTGNILPNGKDLILPFEAVNLKAVDVKVIKVFESNIPQFFQDKDIDDSYNLKKVGRLVHKERIDLIPEKPVDYGNWNTFSIDLSFLINKDPGSLYNVIIDFNKNYSVYPCNNDEEENELADSGNEAGSLETDDEYLYYDSPESYYYNEGYYESGWWSHRDDPCNRAYYNDVDISKNVIATNIGIVAKQGNGSKVDLFINNIVTSGPLSNVEVEILNYQQQSIVKGTSDSQGFVTLECDQTPFLVVARKGEERGYLKLLDGNALSLSRFEVEGAKIEKGLKGFIYGERDVWRPGDSLFLTFVLHDRENSIPKDHPVLMEIFDPMGRMAWKQVQKLGKGKMVAFPFSTSIDDETGKWMAVATVGGAKFTKTLRIETIKPNRLKVNMEFETDTLRSYENQQIHMEVSYLHGAKASNLEVETEITLKPVRTTFKNYKEYIFDDVAAYLDENTFQPIKSKLNADGLLNLKLSEMDIQSSGFVRADFFTRVYENNGEFSVDYISKIMSPYKTYVGIKLPGSGNYWDRLETDVDHRIDIVTVDETGKPMDVNNMTVRVYKISWDWWYERGRQNFASYVNNRNIKPISTQKINSRNGKAQTTFKITYPDWGKYLVYVSIPGGHATGKMVYVDWPGWNSRSGGDDKEGAALLRLSADKQEYQPNQEVIISFPGAENGQAIITIENGSQIMEKYRVETFKGENKWSFTTRSDMTPNIFVCVHLLQPHNHPGNDLPIRMYGVLPLSIRDENTILEPVIEMKDELRSCEKTTISISETNGKEMQYTLAVVDEGLLSLTRFKTPNPWNTFFAREALGVRTWDLYDDILGTFTGNMASVFAVGGDENLEGDDNTQKKRFKPVVKFMGPFTLTKGKTNKHELELPEYIGAVRVMAVAATDNAYGSADKEVIISDPLMIHATLPRILAPNEKVQLPVTVFAMKENLKKVRVQIELEGDVTTTQSEQNVEFDSPGEKIVFFTLNCGEKEGNIHVTATATSGKEKAQENIDVNLRNPNPVQTVMQTNIVTSGTEEDITVNLFGSQGSNVTTLEVASIPPLAVGRRVEYLMRYPHSCAEQTVSAGLAQLLLPDLIETSDKRFENAQGNVLDIIAHLRNYQTPQGAIALWPGYSGNNQWTSCYAAHFLLVAEEKGYQIPRTLKKNLLAYLRSETFENTNGVITYLTETYRLYVLALSGKPDFSAMNRLSEKQLHGAARLRLAAAYAVAGKAEAADNLMFTVDANQILNDNYDSWYSYYWNGPITLAMALETCILTGNDNMAHGLIMELSRELSGNGYMSTHATAWGLYAMWMAMKDDVKDELVSFSYSWGEENKDITTISPITQFALGNSAQGDHTLHVKNESGKKLYVSTTVSGQPLPGDEPVGSKNLIMDVAYLSASGEKIDPGTTTLGEDITIYVQIQHPGIRKRYEDLALTLTIPGGWEILSQPFDGDNGMSSLVDYTDIRDDRVHVYFYLPKGNSITIPIRVHASYAGTYYLPAIRCEAMYQNDVYSTIGGRWVEVQR